MLIYLLPDSDAIKTSLRLTIDFLGLLAASATGRSFAASWSPLWLIAPAMLALAAAMHFLHFALFTEDGTNLYYAGVIFVILLLGAAAGYRARRAYQMGTQYRWLFQSDGMFWTERGRR